MRLHTPPLMPVQRVCCCTMRSRPWWRHEPACEVAYAERFYMAWRQARQAFYDREAA